MNKCEKDNLRWLFSRVVYEVSKSSNALETESDLAEAGSGNGESFQVVVEFLCALIKMFGNEIAVLCTALCSLKTLGQALMCVFSVRVVSSTSRCGLKTTSCSLCSKAGVLTPVLLPCGGWNQAPPCTRPRFLHYAGGYFLFKMADF